MPLFVSHDPLMIMFHGRVHSSHWHQAWVWQIVTFISLYYVWLPRLLLSLCGNQALGDTRSHDARPELVQLECVIVLWKLSFEVDANSIVPLFALGGGNITNNPRLCERGLCWKYMTPQFFSPVLCSAPIIFFGDTCSVHLGCLPPRCKMDVRYKKFLLWPVQMPHKIW